MITAALIIIIPILIVAYLCLSIKVGLIVFEKTEGSGFEYGFYLIAVVTMLALPFSIAALFIG